MKSETVRYTATIAQNCFAELKALAQEKKIPSVNSAINDALNEYLKTRKAAQYEALMHEAGHDEAFLARTLSCLEDFKAVDSEVSGTW